MLRVTKKEHPRAAARGAAQVLVEDLAHKVKYLEVEEVTRIATGADAGTDHFLEGSAPSGRERETEMERVCVVAGDHAFRQYNRRGWRSFLQEQLESRIMKAVED